MTLGNGNDGREVAGVAGVAGVARGGAAARCDTPCVAGWEAATGLLLSSNAAPEAAMISDAAIAVVVAASLAPLQNIDLSADVAMSSTCGASVDERIEERI